MRSHYIVLIVFILLGLPSDNVNALMVADKQDSESVSGTKKTESSPKDKKIKSKPKNAGSTSGGKGAPVKGFKPSEEIEADKAVDFPVDI